MIDSTRLYALLPELYRYVDAASGDQPLAALTAVLDETRDLIERDIAALYRDWFVATAAPEILPLLGALVGVNDLPDAAANPRALVAEAVAYARAKGTIGGAERRLERLGGWPVRITMHTDRRTAVVEVFGDTTARLGGGAYDRGPVGRAHDWLAYVTHHALPSDDAGAEGDGPPVFASIAEAIAAWCGVPGDGVIRILDSADYAIDRLVIDGDKRVCPTDPDAPRALTIEALSGEFPALHGMIDLRGAGAGLRLTIAGCRIAGRIEIAGAAALRLIDASVHPGLPRGTTERKSPAAIVAHAEAGQRPSIDLERCLVGPVALAHGTTLGARDGVIDGLGGWAIRGAGDVSLACVTLIGGVACHSLEATDSLFAGAVEVADRDAGALRTSVVPDGGHTPPLVDCVTGAAAHELEFVAIDHGQPGYAQIARSAQAIRTGAIDGGEIGVGHAARAAERRALIEDRVGEMLPLGIAHRIVWR